MKSGLLPGGQNLAGAFPSAGIRVAGHREVHNLSDCDVEGLSRRAAKTQLGVFPSAGIRVAGHREAYCRAGIGAESTWLWPNFTN